MILILRSFETVYLLIQKHKVKEFDIIKEFIRQQFPQLFHQIKKNRNIKDVLIR